MNSIRNLLLPFLILPQIGIFSNSFAIEYKTPESAVFDASTASYYVSNFKGHNITKISENNDVSDFVCELSYPLGLTIMGNRLFVIDNPRWIKGFELANGEETFCVEIPEAQFLNDLTTDGKATIYATDSRAGHIYRIDILSGSVDRMVPDTIPGVNGICYDPHKIRLVACSFNIPAVIIEIPLETETPEIHILKYEGFVNLDGITMDQMGNFLISTWGPGDFGVGFGKKAGIIYQFDSDFSHPPRILFQGLDGPADIAYDPYHNQCLIPLFLGNDFSILKMGEERTHVSTEQR